MAGLRLTIFPLVLLGVGSCKTTEPLTYSKAQPQDRKILGKAHAYLPVGPDNTSILNGSMAERRKRAWEIVYEMIKPVPVDTEFARKTGIEAPRLPLWQTFYESSEYLRMFESLYEALGDEDRMVRENGNVELDQAGLPKAADFCPTQMEEVFDWHASKRLAYTFPPRRFNQRLGQLKNQAAIEGLSGTGLTLFSPGLLYHYFQNYRRVYQCDKAFVGDVPANNKGLSDSNFTRCFAAEFPSGNTNLNIPSSGNYASGCSYNQDGCDGGQDQDCSQRQIGGSVAIKTSWNLKQAGSKLGVFDTSAENMEKILGEGEWKTDDFIDPSSRGYSDIYTVDALTFDNQTFNSFQLMGLHIMTKEIRDWVWISLWWSDDPDSDFGADRPDKISELGAWKNYKMCVVTGYKEGDPSPGQGMEESLQEVLKVTGAKAAPHTWCSNPYIELGKGNAPTNCIGCHQHAGTKVYSPDVFSTEGGFNDGGRSKMRQNFPADYLWSFDSTPDFFQSKTKKMVEDIDN